MLSALSNARASLKVLPHQKTIFLHPGSGDNQVGTGHERDPVLSGQVVLLLSKPQQVNSLVVRLIGHYQLLIPNESPDTGNILEKDVTLAERTPMAKGEHRFAFSFSLPRTTAPYERCPFGRIRHVLYAIANVSGMAVKASADIFVVVNPAEDGETLRMNLDMNGFNDNLGIYEINLRSHHATVSGLVHFAFSLPLVPCEIHIHSITGYINQCYALQPLARPSVKVTPAPHRRPLFEITHRTPMSLPGLMGKYGAQTVVDTKHSPSHPRILASVYAGEALRVRHIARFPDDDLLRATTLEGTQTIIKVSHQIVIDTAFSIGHSTDLRILRAHQLITVSSCYCMLDSLILPPYSATPPATPSCNSIQHTGNAAHSGLCVCGMTLDTLLNEQGNAILELEPPQQNAGSQTPKFTLHPSG